MSNSLQTKIYAFIDSQNLNLGVRSQGWSIDYKKFRLFLKNKFNVEQAFLFIGMIPTNQKLYAELQQAGFILIFKSTIQYLENGKKTAKGNVDAELVLWAAAKEFSNYDKAMIISGDGDFACLIEYLQEHKKLLNVIAPNKRYSSLLRKFDDDIILISKFKESIEYKNGNKKTRTSGRSKP